MSLPSRLLSRDARSELHGRVPGFKFRPNVQVYRHAIEVEVGSAERVACAADGTLSLPGDLSSLQLRRVVNALLAIRVVSTNSLFIHCAVVEIGREGVLLLGNHGAGKTAVSLLLRCRGARLLAGDAAVVDVSCSRFLGGTRTVLLRPETASDLGIEEMVRPTSLPTFTAGGEPDARVEADPCDDVITERPIHRVVLVDARDTVATDEVLGSAATVEALTAAASDVFLRSDPCSGSSFLSELEPAVRAVMAGLVEELANKHRIVRVTGSPQDMAERLLASSPRDADLVCRW